MIDRVLLDIDGVLADFVGGASRFHNKEYPHQPIDPDNQTKQTDWNIELVFGMRAPELWAPLGFDFWSTLEPLPWMQDVVSLLEQKFGEEHICLLTSPIRTDGCIDGKMAWIRKHLPSYKRRFLVGPAKEFCASPCHVLVDDHTKNIEAFKDAGGHTFLFPAPWNPRFSEHPITALTEWLNTVPNK